MRALIGPIRRVLWFVLAAALGLPVEVVAAPGQEVRELHQRAHKALSEARALQAEAVDGEPENAERAAKEAARLLRDAGEKFAEAAKLQPEGPDTRVGRRDLLDQAVSVFYAAYRTWPVDSAPLERAKIRVDRYIQQLVEHYGKPGAESLAEFKAAQAHAEALDADLAAHRPASPAPVATIVVPPPAPPVSVESGNGIRTPPVPVNQPRTYPLRVALGISAGLLGASAAGAIGAAAQITRRPFKGGLYQEIERASVANGLPHAQSDDLCGGRARDVAAVADACDRRDRVAGVAVAMTVLSGAFAASTVVFAVLLARTRGSQAGPLRRHAAGVIVAPQRGGAVLTLGARF